MVRFIDYLYLFAAVAVVIVVLTPVCLFVFCTFWFSYEDYSQRVSFDSATWKDEASQSQDNPVRLRMVNDLLRRHRLVGITRAEVDELLGVPPQTGYFRKYDYVYWLGPERGFMSIDSEWLVLKFDHDKVIEARLVRD
jgi:hypothetical protein